LHALPVKAGLEQRGEGSKMDESELHKTFTFLENQTANLPNAIINYSCKPFMKTIRIIDL